MQTRTTVWYNHRSTRVATPLLALLTALGLASACRPKTPPGAPQGLTPLVSVARPILTAITNYDEYPARFEAVEAVEVRARVSGYIESIHFTDGAEVKAGDLLVIIDPRPFAADLARAQAERLRAQAGVEQAKAQQQQILTRLELARNDLQRATRLQQARAISEEELDLRTKAVREAEAALQAAQAAVAAAEAAVAAAEAAIKTAQLNLDYTRVTAPIAGRVGRRLVTVGNLVQGGGQAPGTVLVTLVTHSPIYACFDVSERAYFQYRKAGLALAGAAGVPALPCEARLDGEPDFLHHGQVDFLDNQLTPATGTLRLRAVFANTDRALVPGAFARLRLPVERLEKALLIPEGAILAEQTRKFVYVLGPDQTVQPRPVVLGRPQGLQRVILSGLTPDDSVVVSGLLMLRPGMKVQVGVPGQPPAAPTNAPAAKPPAGKA
ncbi:MAG: efflux RND transporter periplasmic adaptor subunit [Verrucomicrobiae bacterium]|nr:efflux RND transporter periplasmic adaptor subunit [Verrucomicrobiae bacterium]